MHYVLRDDRNVARTVTKMQGALPRRRRDGVGSWHRPDMAIRAGLQAKKRKPQLRNAPIDESSELQGQALVIVVKLPLPNHMKPVASIEPVRIAVP